jgi:hypothetical protein
MAALLIGEPERQKIAELIAVAAAGVMSPQRALDAANEDLAGYRDMMGRMLSIELPVGYYVTYSHERQPSGLCHHISVSVDRPGKMPSVEAVNMILEAFGMQPVLKAVPGKRVWIEDVEPGQKAINIVQPVDQPR